MHELLALVYYDGLQNVVPFYDQRSVIPSKDSAWIMFCQNSMRHFQKAFAHKYVILLHNKFFQLLLDQSGNLTCELQGRLVSCILPGKTL